MDNNEQAMRPFQFGEPIHLCPTMLFDYGLSVVIEPLCQCAPCVERRKNAPSPMTHTCTSITDTAATFETRIE